MFVDLHDCSLITASVAVVWSREDGDNILLVTPVITVHDQLMSTSNQSETICSIELLADVLAKRVTVVEHT